MALEQRKYKDGDHVIVVYQKWHMIVVSASECLKDWNYRLAFPKKDGTINKRMSHRFFWQTDLKEFNKIETVNN